MRGGVGAGDGGGGGPRRAVVEDGAGLPQLPRGRIPRYFELDGTFPNHGANPLEPKNVVDLQAAVLALKAGP